MKKQMTDLVVTKPNKIKKQNFPKKGFLKRQKSHIATLGIWNVKYLRVTEIFTTELKGKWYPLIEQIVIICQYNYIQ